MGGRMGFGEWFLRLWNRVQGWNRGAEGELAFEKIIGDASRHAKIHVGSRIRDGGPGREA